jgi:hypothetical protein
VLTHFLYLEKLLLQFLAGGLVIIDLGLQRFGIKLVLFELLLAEG